MPRTSHLGCVLLAVGWIAAAGHAAERPPNIVVILADDLGVGDIQAHYPDNKIATPCLDRLVAQGMSFTDAHSPSAVCSPTRYGLLTGRYAWRTALQEWVVASYEPPLIDADRVTLPGMLRQHGYATACVGKWHLGLQWQGPQQGQRIERRNGQWNLEWDFDQPFHGGPTERGFDSYFGTDVPNMPPFTFLQDDRVVTLPTDRYVRDPTEGVHLPGQFEGAPMAPGWRMQEILPALTRRATQVIREQAAQDQPFFLYFSMTSPHEPVVPTAEFQGQSGIAPIADWVMQTDACAGEVIRAIDDAGIADRTLVIFTADNGHSHYTGWDELVQAGHHPSGPYRGHKGDIWEGGHRVPLVVRWPGHVAAASTSDQLVSLTDLFALCADVVGAPLPELGAEDSVSFLPALTRQPGAPMRTTAVQHSNVGEFAYREGPWKLVFKMSGANLEASRGEPTLVQLYDLEQDLAESKDLAGQHPDLVARLTRQLAEVVASGASRDGVQSANDVEVRFDVTQRTRWAARRGE